MSVNNNTSLTYNKNFFYHSHSMIWLNDLKYKYRFFDATTNSIAISTVSWIQYVMDQWLIHGTAHTWIR